MPGNSSSQGGSNYRGGGYGGGGNRGGYYPRNSYWGGSYYWGGNYYYSGGYYYSPYYDSFGHYRYGYPPFYSYAPPAGATSTNDDRLPVFFPPIPPPLGAPTPPQQPVELSLVAPPELAAYINEPFFAPLSTRLARRNLTDQLRQRLDSYRANKTALQTELRAKLAALKDADAATRQRDLEAFAPQQTPRIVALEKAADQLRGDFLQGGLIRLFGSSGDWNQNRQWHLGQSPLSGTRAETLPAEFQVDRAAVFYQDGLAPAQRRLLREVAMDVQVDAFKPKSAPASPEDNSLMYFSPETARVRLPDELTSEIAAKVEAYTKEKTELKTELRDAIYLQDKATSAQRDRVLKQLAESQAPRIAALEILAEDIRQALALQAKQPGPPVPPSLPPELAKRITIYQSEKLALRKLLQDKLKELGKGLTLFDGRVPPVQKDIGNDPHTDEISKSPTGEDRRKLAKDVLTAFNQATADRFTASGKEKEAIRGELDRFIGANPESTKGKSADTLLKEFEDSVLKEETWQQYGEYQIAVFQPGLSPEQRRLLFDAAIEKLALPLPGGERIP
jgi:hypothetical protein